MNKNNTYCWHKINFFTVSSPQEDWC